MTQIFETAEVKADDLVGEGKKFKSVDELARGKAESDAFIKRLESEMAELRKDLDTRLSAEDQLNELREQFKKMKEQGTTQSRDNTSPALSEDTVKALIARTITETEQERSANQNISEANAQMVKAYGSVEAAKAHLIARSQELGLSVEDLQRTAAKSPTAFVQLVGLPKVTPESNVLPFKSTVSVPHTGGAPEVGTKEYFDEIRKKNPRQYWDPSTQQRIVDAAKAGTYKIPGYNA